LGPYGSTALSSHEIKSLARTALQSEESGRIDKVEVFFMDTPHSGSTVEEIDVIFERFENNDRLLIGRDPLGHVVVFFLGDTTRPATFITQKPHAAKVS
jgi:hypothetical protein